METLTDILSHSWRNVLSRELDEMQDRYRIRCSFDRLTLKGYNHRDPFVVRSRGERWRQADRFKGESGCLLELQTDKLQQSGIIYFLLTKK